MRTLATLLPALVLVVACGGAGDATGEALANSPAADAEVTVCSCALEPISTNARVEACDALLSSMGEAEFVEASMACRTEPPAGGPDLCFCIQTTSTNPEVMQACEALMPEDPSRSQLTALVVDCARKGY